MIFAGILVLVLVAACTVSATAQEIQVTVTSAKIGRAPLNGGGVSAEPVLAIHLRIRNASHAPVEYRGWAMNGADDVMGDYRARLRDDTGNRCHQIVFPFGRPAGQQSRERIVIAGDYLEDVLVFEAPATEAQELHLTLPGQIIGTRSDLRIGIPASTLIGREAPETETEPEPEPAMEPTTPQVTNPEIQPISTSTTPAIDPELESPAEETAEPEKISLFTLLLVGFGGVIYCVPMFVAACRSHHDLGSIIVINVFFGLTLIGWCVALAMACSYVIPHAERRRQARRTHRRSPQPLVSYDEYERAAKRHLNRQNERALRQEKRPRR